MSSRTNLRTALAVVLSLLYPGLGHAYLREWFRALVWFFLNMTSFALLMPPAARPDSLGWSEVVAAAEAVPPEAALALASVTVFSMIDTYWMAKRQDREAAVEDGTTCPNCGRDVDPDLDFCHWCTERIGPDPDADDATADARSNA